jgi:hypothetical protein
MGKEVMGIGMQTYKRCVGEWAKTRLELETFESHGADAFRYSLCVNTLSSRGQWEWLQNWPKYPEQPPQLSQ